jgi:hypothetical protein
MLYGVLVFPSAGAFPPSMLSLHLPLMTLFSAVDIFHAARTSRLAFPEAIEMLLRGQFCKASTEKNLPANPLTSLFLKTSLHY